MRTASLCFAALLTVAATAAGAQNYSHDLIDPQLSRDFGRAVGQATIAAHRLAAEARVAAHQAADEYRRGYADAVGTPPRRYGIASEREAVDACALAAEDEAGRSADFATVNDIVDIDRFGDGWDIEGTVETRDSYRDSRADEWRFRCAIRSGQVERVGFEDRYARR